MKIAMDSSVLYLYERMLNPYDRQQMPGPNLRYSQNDKIAFDNIDALEKIHRSGQIFCKLPSNKETLKQCPKADEYLAECFIKSLNIHKFNQRIIELNICEDLPDEFYRLLGEAEQCGINIILTLDDLSAKSNNVKIVKPADYFNK